MNKHYSLRSCVFHFKEGETSYFKEKKLAPQK